MRVQDVMTERVKTILPAAAAEVVVLTSGRVVGIVTVFDLLELVGKGVDRGASTRTRWTLKHRAPHRRSHRSSAAW